jgi:hypothetical protein
MRGIDLSSWQAVLSTVLGLGLVTLVMVSIRLMFMQTIQRRRERQNRQINERLRTLIAAYKTLGGSFTGNLEVDPGASARPARSRREALAGGATAASGGGRIRDAVEAALSDILLLGTEEQVRLAAQAANDLAAGRTVHVAELVVSLRNFIREVLDLGRCRRRSCCRRRARFGRRPAAGAAAPVAAATRARRGGGRRRRPAGAAAAGRHGRGRRRAAGLGFGAALGDAHDEPR